MIYLCIKIEKYINITKRFTMLRYIDKKPKIKRKERNIAMPKKRTKTFLFYEEIITWTNLWITFESSINTWLVKQI
jgi:hypothetical protein